MLKSLTSAVSGLKNHQTLMDVIGNNIANVNTSGFRASRAVFSDVYYQTLQGASASSASTGGTNPSQIGYGSKVATVYVNNSDSSYTETGRPLDQYIDGDGYFVLKDATNNTKYSRIGNFYFDGSGNMVDENGNFVCDASGSIINLDNTKSYSSVSISSTGLITAVPSDGSASVTMQIGLVNFPNPDGLAEAGNGYYTATTNSGTVSTAANPGSSGTGTLVSGALESSNVDLTDEFTNMIVAERGYQANARVITTSDEILQELVGLKR